MFEHSLSWSQFFSIGVDSQTLPPATPRAPFSPVGIMAGVSEERDMHVERGSLFPGSRPDQKALEKEEQMTTPLVSRAIKLGSFALVLVGLLTVGSLANAQHDKNQKPGNQPSAPAPHASAPAPRPTAPTPRPPAPVSRPSTPVSRPPTAGPTSGGTHNAGGFNTGGAATHGPTTGGATTHGPTTGGATMGAPRTNNWRGYHARTNDRWDCHAWTNAGGATTHRTNDRRRQPPHAWTDDGRGQPRIDRRPAGLPRMDRRPAGQPTLDRRPAGGTHEPPTGGESRTEPDGPRMGRRPAGPCHARTNDGRVQRGWAEYRGHERWRRRIPSDQLQRRTSNHNAQSGDWNAAVEREQREYSEEWQRDSHQAERQGERCA